MADIGTILGGRYRVVAQLGQGGMATIYRAIDTQLGREVAVKLLRPEYLRDPDFGSRFRQEAQNAASLSHPNVVTVYDYGEDPPGPFIVMEYVDGEDLATILRRNAPLPPVQSTRIAAAVCYGGPFGAAGKSAGPRRWLRRLREVIEHLALHAFDFGPISARYEWKLLWAAAYSQARQQVEEVRDPLPSDCQLLIVLNHGRISTMPRRRPSRFRSQ